MDDPEVEGPSPPDVSTLAGQRQLLIMFVIRRIVLRQWLLEPADERVLFTVSRSGYLVYWPFVKQQLFSDGGGFRRF